MSGDATAQTRAAQFVARHGDVTAQGRAQVLCGGGGAKAVLERVGDADRADPSALLRALSLCDELGAMRAPLARRCAASLERLQAPDGGFGDASAPEAERRRLCGRLGGLLARTPFARPETLDAAGGFLAERFAPELLQGFQYGNIEAFARFFANAPHDAADAILQWCGRELERGFRTRRFDALATAHVLALCDAHALPGARLEREELLLCLLGEQARDGSFGGGEAPGARVEPTLRALRVLRFLGAGRARAGVDSPPVAR